LRGGSGERRAVFGLRSFKIGSLFGIPIELNSSWFLIFFLVAFTLTTSYLPQALPGRTATVYVGLAVLMSIAFFGSIVVHEFAHSLVARAGGMRISRVTLFFFGGVSQMEEEPRGPGREFLRAAAGPAASLVLAVIGFGVLRLMGSTGDTVRAPVEYLAYINLYVAAFNLLPGFPLDGGRLLRSTLWAITGDLLKATRWASRMGQFLGSALIIVAVVGVLGGTLDLIWFAVMGWFLASISAAAYQQQVLKTRLAAIPLSGIMSSPVTTVSGTTTLEEMAHSYFLGGRHSRYPVVDAGRVIGLVDLQAVRDVSRDRWNEMPVSAVAHRDLSEVVATPETTVDQVLTRLEPTGPGAVLVVEDGRLAGIVTRADVIRLVGSLDAS
jgi:Zn-dependent protease/predicted transcriptional regulator